MFFTNFCGNHSRSFSRNCSIFFFWDLKRHFKELISSSILPGNLSSNPSTYILKIALRILFQESHRKRYLQEFLGSSSVQSSRYFFKNAFRDSFKKCLLFFLPLLKELQKNSGEISEFWTLGRISEEFKTNRGDYDKLHARTFEVSPC